MINIADVGTLLMKVKANTKDFDSKMGKVNKALGNVGKAALVGGAVAAGALALIATKSIKLAADQEKAEARLESIAKKVTKATDEQIKSMKDLAAAQQKVSTFGDEVLITGQSQLLSFGLQTDQVEQLTGSLADLLAANNGVNATTEDAIGAANLLGKAFSGQVGALSRVGILLDDAQGEILKNGTAAEKTAILVEVMNQNYGGLAKTLSETTEGQMKQAKNAIGDIGEKIGGFFLPMINDALQIVMENMPQIEAVFLKVFGAISTAVEVFVAFAKEYLFPILETVFKYIQENYPQMKETFLAVFNSIFEVIKTVWDILEVTLFPVLKAVFGYMKDVAPTVGKVFISAFNSINKVLKIVSGTFEKLIGWIKDAYDWLTKFFKKKDSGSLSAPVYGSYDMTGSGVTNTLSGTRAFGGSVQAGSSYLVGEKGKEVFTPSTNGMISASGGGGVTININGTNDPNVIMNKVVQVLRQNNIINR